MEYLYAISGNNGKRFVYQLAFYGEDEDEAPKLRGLVDIEQLKKQLRENGNGTAQRSAVSGSKRANLAVEEATLR